MKSLILFMFFTLSIQLFASGWNEMQHADGSLRPQYKEFTSLYPQFSLAPTDQSISVFMNNPMGDQLKILPIPLILSDKEHELVRRGAQQRAEALAYFWFDVILGNQNIFKEGILSKEDFAKIVLLQTENKFTLEDIQNIWRGRSFEDIRFFHGPDVVRAPDGSLRVLEDNVGPLGGLSDADAMHEVFERSIHRTGSFSINFYESAILRFLNDQPAKMKMAPSIAFVQLRTAFDTKNFETIKDEELTRGEDTIRRFTEKHKIPFYFLNWTILPEFSVEIKDKLLKSQWDVLHSLQKDNTQVFVLDSRGIEYMGLADPIYKEILKMFHEGKIHFMSSPFTDILSNKSLLPYIETFIDYYLSEESILESQRSWMVHKVSLKELKEREGLSLEDLVFKSAQGSQGREIWVVKDLPTNYLESLKSDVSKIRADQELGWVWQKRVDVSHMPSSLAGSWIHFNVDMRPLSYVHGNKVFTHDRIWGRASLRLPGVLNNVSQGAFELVVTTPTGPHCKIYFSN